MNKLGLTLTLALAVGALQMSRVAKADDGCIWIPQIQGFEAGPQDTLIIETSNKTKFSVTFNGPCDDIDFAETIRFPDAVTNEFCPGDTVLVGHERCWSNTITKVQN
jgi:hypothetical protein